MHTKISGMQVKHHFDILRNERCALVYRKYFPLRIIWNLLNGLPEKMPRIVPPCTHFEEVRPLIYWISAFTVNLFKYVLLKQQYYSERFSLNIENTAVNRPLGALVEQTFVSAVITVLFPGIVLLAWTVVLLLWPTVDVVVTCKRKYFNIDT